MALDRELQQAVAARVNYFRDLGIFDFYRRGEPLPLTAASSEAQATLDPLPAMALQNATATTPAMAASELLENSPDMARAVPPIPVLPSLAPIAPARRGEALQAIREEIGDCTRCPLSATRNKIVFGDGDPNARLMFVGEGPGADEDAQGLPFVGRGGQLLNNMINAMGLKREEVYIANIVKCRPPQNRVPEPVEANTCTPFLFQQISVIRPQILVALGSTAATYLLGGIKRPLSVLRGRIHEALGTRLIVTYHPAYLLRDPTQKKEAWKDLQMAMAELGLKAKRAGS
ncbi:Uracil-DNA glycosylase, family 4 [Acidisarcina polymorpha]|uniref:Type-4 uracil-DNA glycosylase n=1 Tax=Acidisarcina polymorpha TaxID=2211140 RepID=A0A2Z5FZF9_9BACT|nr:uracil-DNA glycosylase [Acidisarcina polymorpha]AXC11756.1 Uracil-DNA glycosylase, family 4 [Acidisarcina polymorpha]